LQTVDAIVASGGREEYPDLVSSIVPYMRMAYTNTGGDISSTGYQLGIFLVKAHYTVRGRRSVPLTPLIRLKMMGFAQLEEFKSAMQEVERERQRDPKAKR
jgi:hypothetical protein